MPSLQNGSVRLFRFAGIDLFLHWSWFLVAAYEINGRTRTYSSLTWNFLEYVSLFLIVMLHEYGHALACRQVGGTRTASCCGLSAEWHMLIRRRGRAPHFGVSPPAH